MEGKGPKSLSDLKSGIHVYGDKDESSKKEVFCITKPHWYDESKFKRGQRFFVVHRLSIITNFIYALMVGLTVDALTDALIFTQATVGPANARKRYVHTLDYLIRWHTGGDIFDPKSIAGASILTVRNKHHHVRTAMTKCPKQAVQVNRKSEKVSPKPLPMNQYDMAIVQSGFIGPMMLQPKLLGIKATEEELGDYVYFWRVVGWCLGIRDEYNMCGLGWDNAVNIAQEVLDNIIIPGLKNPEHNYTLLLQDFVKGLRLVDPGLNTAAVYKYIFPFMGLPPPKLKFSEWPYYISTVITAWLGYHIPLCRWLFNTFYKYAIGFIIWLYSGSEKVCLWTKNKETKIVL